MEVTLTYMRASHSSWVRAVIFIIEWPRFL